MSRRNDRQRLLGGLTHDFISPLGTVHVERVGDLNVNGAAPGGDAGASGWIPESLAKSNPEVFTFGTRWVIRSRDDDIPRWGGILLDPAFDGQRAVIAGRGHSTLADKNSDLICYQSRAYGDWLTDDSDPFPYSNSEKFSYDNSGGKLQWTVSESTTFTIREGGGFTFWAALNPIHRVAGLIHASDTANTHFRIRIFKGTGPDGARDEDTIDGLPLNQGEFDRDLAPNYNDLVSVHLARQADDPGTVTTPLTVWISNLRVNGVATADEMSPSEVMRDLMGRMAVPALAVNDAAPANALPLFIKEGPFSDPMNLQALLVDWCWRLIEGGNGPVGDWNPWGTRKWAVLPSTEVHLAPLERFNEVLVPYVHSGGVSDNLRIAADPDPFPNGIVNTYTQLSMQDPLPEVGPAQQMGQFIANYLATRRFAGSAVLHRVRDESGNIVSAYNVRAGDMLWLPTVETWLRVKDHTYSDSSVSVTFDDNLAALDRLMGQRNRRLAVGGQVAR